MRSYMWVPLLALIGMAMPARAAWHEVRSPHFRVYAEGATDVTRKFVSDMERFDIAARKLLGLGDNEGDDPNPLTVFMVDDVAAVARLCRGSRPADKITAAKIGKACKYVAGFYNGRASGSVAFVPRSAGQGSPLSPNTQIILFHEYAHHLLLGNSLAVYPAWYSEGMAEFLSNAKLDRAGEVGIGLPAVSRAYALFRQRAIPVREILTASPSTLSPDDQGIFYSRAWLLTHYLSLGPRIRDSQLTAYLQAINKGRPNAEAAREAFGDLDQLNKEVERYMRGRMAYLPVAVTPLPPERIRIRRLPPGEDAMMPIRLLSDRRVNDETAPKVAAEARALAAPWPSDPGAQTILAEAEYDAGNDDAAEAAADRALGVRPNDADAMIYKALAIMHRAQAAGRRDEAPWRSARNWLLKANGIENDAAWPLLLFYRSFVEQGRKPTPNAVDALERSVALVPQDDGVRLMLVTQWVRDGKLDRAKDLLRPLAYYPHARANSPARRLLDAIEARGADALSNWSMPVIEEGPIELPPEEPEPKAGK